MVQPVERAPFLDAFYARGHAATLLHALGTCASPPRAGAPPPAPPSALAAAAELLCFCASTHSYVAKFFAMKALAPRKVLALLSRREAWLRAAAVRYARACIGSRDDFYVKHFVQHDLVRPLLTGGRVRGGRRNLYDAALLDLLECVRRDNMAPLVAHLVTSCASELNALDAPDTVAGLRLRHAQNEERAAAGRNAGAGDGDDPATAAIGPRQPAHLRGLDRDEESYFAEGGDDDEDDGCDAAAVAALAAATGAPTWRPPPRSASPPPPVGLRGIGGVSPPPPLRLMMGASPPPSGHGGVAGSPPRAVSPPLSGSGLGLVRSPPPPAPGAARQWRRGGGGGGCSGCDSHTGGL